MKFIRTSVEMSTTNIFYKLLLTGGKR